MCPGVISEGQRKGFASSKTKFACDSAPERKIELSRLQIVVRYQRPIGLQARHDHRIRSLRHLIVGVGLIVEVVGKHDRRVIRIHFAHLDSRERSMQAAGFHPVEAGVEGKSSFGARGQWNTKYPRVATQDRKQPSVRSCHSVRKGRRIRAAPARDNRALKCASSSRYFTNTTSFCFSLYRSSSTFACVSTNPKPPGRSPFFAGFRRAS